MSLFISNVALAQVFTPDNIPVSNDEVVFTKTLHSPFVKNEILSRVHGFIHTNLKPFSGGIETDSPDKTICEITDYLDISSNAFSIFAMYMQYTLSFEYTDSLCLMKIHNIRFMEKEHFENRAVYERQSKELGKKQKKQKPDFQEFTAKEIFIDHNYHLALIRQASEKVTDASIKRINEVFSGLERALDVINSERNRSQR
jgi:hypothetical protein